MTIPKQRRSDRSGRKKLRSPGRPPVGRREDRQRFWAAIARGRYPEVIHRRGPWRGFDDVEYATLEWVAWFNQQRLLEPLGYVPPAEFEEQFFRTHAAHAGVRCTARSARISARSPTRQ